MNLTEFNQSDRCMHFTCPKRTASSALYILLYVCSAAVVLLTVCGNLLIIISIFHFKQLHTPTNVLVLSLAVSDFLVGTLLMSPMAIWVIESCWILGKDLCMFVMMTGYFLTSLSIYHIFLIAVDRYLALSNPFLYANTFSVNKMCIVVFSHWFALLVYNVMLPYVNGNLNLVLCPEECFLNLNYVLSAIDLVITFIFPFAVIFILYSRIVMIATKHATAIRDLNNNTWVKTQKITSHSMKSERKAAKVLGIVVSVFMICLLPYFLYSLLGNVIELQLESLQKVMIVLHLNSTINPFIYALFYPWFRRCVKIILTREIFKTDSALRKIL